MIHYNLRELIEQAADKINIIPIQNGFKVIYIFSKCFEKK